MLGKHCLKAWSKTQSIIAKSSGESDLFGVIKGSTEGLGLITLAKDFGVEVATRVHVDATAAKGMVERRGISRVRHIEVDNLWIQEMEARRMLPIGKVDGGENHADLMTKNVGIELAKKHMRKMGIRFAEGRSDAAAQLHPFEEKDSWSIEQEGNYLRVTKDHRVARSDLYIPGGEDSYPVHSSNFEATRVTIGITSSGKEFEIEDNWRRLGQSRRVLQEAWTGSTTFTVKASARKFVRDKLELTVPGLHGPRAMPQPGVEVSGRMLFNSRAPPPGLARRA